MSIISWFKKEHEAIKTSAIRRVDISGGLSVNTRKLNGLFTGEDNSINLASPLIYNPVNVVKMLVGGPLLIARDDVTQEAADRMVKSYYLDEAPIITQSMLIHGTAWRFPRYIPDRGLVVDTINDDEVQGYKIDNDTGEIVELWMAKIVEQKSGGLIPLPEQILIRRHYTREYIESDIGGKKSVVQNYFRILPVPFAHDCLDGEFRGVSVYSRIYRTAKFSHDILKQAGEVMARFRPKMIQTLVHTGTDTAKDWMKSQMGVHSRHDGIDPLQDDLFINILHDGGKADTTDFKFLSSDSISAYERILALLDKRIILGSGIPEMFFGGVATGNYASADISAELGVHYIRGIQRELTKWYKKLTADYLRIDGYLRLERYSNVEVEWEAFDFVTPTQRAAIFTSYAGGISTLMTAGAMTKDLAAYFLKLFFKSAPHNTAQEYIDEVLAYATDVGSKIANPPIEVSDGDFM